MQVTNHLKINNSKESLSIGKETPLRNVAIMGKYLNLPCLN